MASVALRQLFLESAILLARHGNTEAASLLNSRVRQADRQEIERRGRKRGEVVAARLLTPEDPSPLAVCDHCGDSGAVNIGGVERDYPECAP